MARELPRMDFERLWPRLQQIGLNGYEARAHLVLVGDTRFKTIPRQKGVTSKMQEVARGGCLLVRALGDNLYPVFQFIVVLCRIANLLFPDADTDNFQGT